MNQVDELLPLKVVEKGAFFYGLVGLFAVFFLYGAHLPIVVGFFSGCLVGVCNFRCLKTLARRLMSSEGKRGAYVAFLFAVKIVLLLGITALLVLKWKVNAIAFALGFAAVVFGIFYETGRSLLKGTS